MRLTQAGVAIRSQAAASGALSGSSSVSGSSAVNKAFSCTCHAARKALVAQMTDQRSSSGAASLVAALLVHRRRRTGAMRAAVTQSANRGETSGRSSCEKSWTRPVA